ncbi:MAG TPA: protein-disulfide reductase DsbD family protein [Candidatus Competibacter sp.]|nr:protein-disulfide reductase DsbD family protein [Candidatus Competibacter sp.]
MSYENHCCTEVSDLDQGRCRFRAGKDTNLMKAGCFPLFLCLWFLALAAPSAHGAATVSTAHATVMLLSERSQATPGQTLWLGLRFELIPHWHVYWRNPGASGAAPVIRWTLPEGWAAGDLHWPVPQRIPVGPLTNYGYEGAVMLLAPVRVPEGPLPAGPVTLAADAEWLVCRVECIPESGRFTVELPHPGSPTVEDPATQRLFAAARAQWPEADRVTGRYRLAGDARTITLEAPGLAVDDRAEVWFAAYEWGPVDPSGAQSRQTAAGLTLRVPAGDLLPAGAAPLDGLVVVETRDGGAPARRGYAVRLEAQPAATGASEPLGLMAALGFAFLGGLILNAMPCVLPVLGIKVLGFVREAGANHRRRAGHGLSYGAGILLSFLALAAVLLLLRAGGASLGWGFQLQSPVLVALLAYLMLLVGLNLSGVFAVGAGLMAAGQSLTAGSGLFNTFATGVLAAVVASPCTAPFMGTALGFAITRPAGEALAVFLALGVGFALPVVLLSLWPAQVRWLPKPGPWMKTFQQALAFPLYATAAWLLWVLSQQTDARTYGAALAGLVAVALAAWLYGQWPLRGWRLGLLGAALTVVVLLLLRPVAGPEAAAPARADPERLAWSEPRVRELTAAGRPVFVNFTAAWCITCQVNERVALATENTRRLFADRAVAYLVADWTRRDPVIARQLERHGRSGVPLYLWYAPGSETPVVLPQLLTEGIVAQALQSL